MVHRTDKWDCTVQIISLSAILMDPYYRTVDGLMVLIEKDWISFGHQFAKRTGQGPKMEPNKKNRSPIFLQFCECVYQILSRRPIFFEYNPKLLLTLLENVTSCLFGTFLVDCEKDRTQYDLDNQTASIWYQIKKNQKEYVNPLYEAYPGTIDFFNDDTRYPIYLWSELYFKFRPIVTMTSPSFMKDIQSLPSVRPLSASTSSYDVPKEKMKSSYKDRFMNKKKGRKRSESLSATKSEGVIMQRDRTHTVSVEVSRGST
eukprot:TRINITY_DN1592_c0_g1_i1.p1 TRINITY_DN1592_c0_g1~~TRINITY_DN1592_c0_g1_i1.p1  ORF type:complete len:259 (+),score=43.50 TRINITY_DN1592_c0_g1_i1:943-1719(+)